MNAQIIIYLNYHNVYPLHMV
ncbi:hypothetical protein WCLP8_3270024 [uncultured Gammaproteobacteria bacterium]